MRSIKLSCRRSRISAYSTSESSARNRPQKGKGKRRTTWPRPSSRTAWPIRRPILREFEQLARLPNTQRGRLSRRGALSMLANCGLSLFKASQSYCTVTPPSLTCPHALVCFSGAEHLPVCCVHLMPPTLYVLSSCSFLDVSSLKEVTEDLADKFSEKSCSDDLPASRRATSTEGMSGKLPQRIELPEGVPMKGGTKTEFDPSQPRAEFLPLCVTAFSMTVAVPI